MSEVKVSKRYALSLLEISNEKKILERVKNDMEFFYQTMRKNHNLLLAMDNPVIKPQVKKSILNEIFSNHVHEETLRFLDFIIDKGRENLLQSISEEFLRLVDEYYGIAKVDVLVAFRFSDEQKEQLKNRLEKILNKKIELKFSTDPKLIGGFVAKVGNTLYDASLAHQLDLLRKEFVKGSKVLN